MESRTALPIEPEISPYRWIQLALAARIHEQGATPDRRPCSVMA
ncbi:MAG: hypothetical protein ABI648_00980 [Betaproteobacteria bacterium]